MIKKISNIKSVKYSLFISILSIFIILSLMPQSLLEIEEFHINDKLLHIIGYYILYIFAIWTFMKTKTYSIIIITSLFSLSIVIELLQTIIPGRHFSYADLLANVIGLVMGWITFYYISKRIYILKKQ